MWSELNFDIYFISEIEHINLLDCLQNYNQPDIRYIVKIKWFKKGWKKKANKY